MVITQEAGAGSKARFAAAPAGGAAGAAGAAAGKYEIPKQLQQRFVEVGGRPAPCWLVGAVHAACGR